MHTGSFKSFSTCDKLVLDATYSSCPPYIKYIISRLICIKCVNPYYKYVNHDDTLNINVLTSKGEAPKSYAALATASISLASTGRVWESRVSLDTSCKYVYINCQIIKIEIIYETIEKCFIKNNRLCEE